VTDQSSSPAPRVTRRVLFVSYYFPPESSSGVHRALNLVRYLPANGWHPTVVTAAPDAYPSDSVFDDGLAARVPASVPVVRADLLRLRRRQPAMPVEPSRQTADGSVPVATLMQRVKRALRPWASIPDDKMPWLVPAMYAGWKALRHQRHDAILATGGPWTDLVVAWLLATASGLPLVLDYRDPWTANPYRRSQPRWRRRFDVSLERRIMNAARAVVANTTELESLLRDFQHPPDSTPVCTMTNGFDPDVFDRLPRRPSRAGQPLVLVHTGHVYRHRSPEGLFRALAAMAAAGEVGPDRLRAIFVGSADIDLAALVRHHRLESLVEVRPQVPHHQSLELLGESDVLVLIQSGTQLQIPAKVYEYIGAGKPLIALTDSDAIRRLIVNYRLGVVCEPLDVDAIQAALRDMLDTDRRPQLFAAGAADAFRADRIAAAFARLLDRVSVDRHTDVSACESGSVAGRPMHQRNGL
jgi:glycosyltransferase involved in cell wall biosynthesis